MTLHRRLCFALSITLVVATTASAQPRKLPTNDELREKLGDHVEAVFDQAYAATDNPKQMLDLYVPKQRGDKPLPVVVSIHGGGWINGDRKASAGIAAFAKQGNYIAVAISYRLSNEAKWPAQMHDCKAAIRWLRGNAKRFNLDPDRIGVQGSSAGGHLVAMLALTADRKELEGDLGEFTGQSSRVTCAVDFCGPTDLTLPLMQGKAAEVDDPAVAGLVGSPIKEHLDVARSASPINYVTKDAAPLLIAHGTNDLRVNFEQSKTLYAALEKVGAPVWLIPVTDGGHSMGGGQELTARVQAFLDRYLRDEKNDLSTTPIPTQPETKKP